MNEFQSPVVERVANQAQTAFSEILFQPDSVQLNTNHPLQTTLLITNYLIDLTKLSNPEKDSNLSSTVNSKTALDN